MPLEAAGHSIPPDAIGASPLIRLADCACSHLLHTIVMAPDDGEFELRYDDYAEVCREAGVDPLTFEALRRSIAALTEAPQPTMH